jgi:hypothetical protein
MASDFLNLGSFLESYGVVDVLLPFILVFAIIFAVLQRIKILGDRKNINGILALVLALLFVVPHITGSYPLGYDPVEVMNQTLPSIALVAVAAVMLLILMGIFGADFSASAAPIIAIVSIVFVVYIFGAALELWNDPSDIFRWWDAQTTELILIILVFGVIVWFITKEPSSERSQGGQMLKNIGKLFERR